jgi:pimeloyl-ACP methyl ester carboxylesterase
MLTAVVRTGCGPVEYSEAGAGTPILYFHGAGVTGDAMLAVEAPLIEDGFRLIVPNRPGYGKTPLSPHASAGCANVASALLDALGVADTAVMGSSGGAAFAVSFATHHPDRTRSLVLLCPQLHRWDDERWLPAASRWTLPLLRRRWVRKALLALYRFHLPRMGVDRFLRTEAGDRYPDAAGDPAARRLGEATLAAMARGTRCPGFENDFVVFTRDPIVGPDRPLRAPTLIAHDVTDPMAPAAHVDWFVSTFPHCERVPLHAAGHLVWVGPDAAVMHRARVQFLREHSAPAA